MNLPRPTSSLNGCCVNGLTHLATGRDVPPPEPPEPPLECPVPPTGIVTEWPDLTKE